MKRVLIFIILLFISINLFATLGESPSSSRGFKIEGGVGKYNQVNITPIYATSSEQINGFPFDITGSDVKYTTISSGGRQIAEWSVATNYSNVKFTITATDLVFENDASISIPYHIVFHIMYASFNENGTFKENVHEDFDLKSGSSKTFEVDNTLSYEPFPVVSYDQDIRFFFDKGTDSLIESCPYGYYSSTITITVAGE